MGHLSKYLASAKPVYDRRLTKHSRNGLFHPNSFYMPFNVLLACGGQWQRYTYVKLIRKDPGLITNAKIAFRALESFSRFYPSPILGLQEIRLEVNVFGGANRDDNSQDIICILQHLSLMENLKSLRFWFHTYEGIKDFLRLPDKMPYNDSFLDVFAALTEVYVKKAEITGLKCEETTRELKDLMMGKTVWDETRSLDVWAQNDAWYMAQEIQQNQQNQENQGNQDMDPWW